MNTKFASASYTAGQLNAIVKLLKKQAGEDGPVRFLRGEITVSELPRAWREQDGVIYFSVVSDGTEGEDWIERMEDKNYCLSDYAKSVLRSPDFRPTNGVTTQVAVLKSMLFSDNDRVTKKIRAEADRRKLKKPNAEMACLIREKFTDEELKAMSLWGIVAMHEPIKDADGDPYLLDARRLPPSRLSGGRQWLCAYYDGPGHAWDRWVGFAFTGWQV